MLAALGYIIGAVVIAIGSALGIGWFIGNLEKHPSTCSCNACQIRRQREWRSKHPHVEPRPINEPHDPVGKWAHNKKGAGGKLGNMTWLSTLELQPGMRVVGGRGGKTIYVVDQVVPWSHGIAVHLTSVLPPHAPSIVPIPTDRTQRKIWLVRTPRSI